MGQYASSIPDFEAEVLRIVDEALFHPSELRDKLLAHIEQGARSLGLLPASTPGSGSTQLTGTGTDTPASTPASGLQASPDTLSAEQSAALDANTGTVSEGSGPAPWRYDPVTGAPINRPADSQPVTFGTPLAGADQTGGPESAVAGP